MGVIYNFFYSILAKFETICLNWTEYYMSYKCPNLQINVFCPDQVLEQRNLSLLALLLQLHVENVSKIVDCDWNWLFVWETHRLQSS